MGFPKIHTVVPMFPKLNIVMDKNGIKSKGLFVFYLFQSMVFTEDLTHHSPAPTYSIYVPATMQVSQ